MTRSLRLLVAALALAALAARPARAATTLVIQRGTRQPTTTYADGDHMRVGVAGGGDITAVLLDAAAKKLVMINDRDKTYTEITEEQLKQMRERVMAARANMAEQIKNLPPEKRQKMESMMPSLGTPGGKPPEWKFELLGEKKTVNGMPCETYRVLVGGKLHEEDCILPWSSKLLKKSDFSGVEQLTQALSETSGASQGGGIPAFNKYPGLPISRVLIGPKGERGEEEQVKSITQGPLPKGTFAVPAGYTKKVLPEGITGPSK